MATFAIASPRKAKWAHTKGEKERIFREFDRYIDCDISNGLLWVFLHLPVCYYTQARSPPRLMHQQVRERRIHPWDEYVSMSRVSLHNSSPTWCVHAASLCNNSSCVTGAPLQGSSLSGERANYDPVSQSATQISQIPRKNEGEEVGFWHRKAQQTAKKKVLI